MHTEIITDNLAILNEKDIPVEYILRVADGDVFAGHKVSLLNEDFDSDTFVSIGDKTLSGEQCSTLFSEAVYVLHDKNILAGLFIEDYEFVEPYAEQFQDIARVLSHNTVSPIIEYLYTEA